MSFVRPEVAARLRVWREPVAWALLTALGLWLIWHGYAGAAPLGFVAGAILAVAGIGLLLSAMRRLRLSRADLAEGVVVVDEARIGYLGPREGGFVDVPTLVSVEIGTSRSGEPAWILTAEDGTRLVIPLGARGAEGVFDALSALPGADFDGAAAAAGRGAIAHPALVWHRAVDRNRRRLH